MTFVSPLVNRPGFDGLVGLMRADNLHAYDLFPKYPELVRHCLINKILEIRPLYREFKQLRAESEAKLNGGKPRLRYSERESKILKEAEPLLMEYCTRRQLPPLHAAD